MSTNVLPNPYTSEDHFSDFYKMTRYQQDGRVEIGNQCITSEKDESLSLTDCVDAPTQEWQFSDGDIIHRDTSKCLSDTSPMKLVNCNSDEKGKFIDTEEPDIKFPRWNKKFGKNVVLVSADNPWYINKNTTVPVEVKEYPNQTNQPWYKSFGRIPRNIEVPISATQPESGVEYFGTFSKPRSHEERVVGLIACLLIIIICIQIAYLYFSSK